MIATTELNPEIKLRDWAGTKSSVDCATLRKGMIKNHLFVKRRNKRIDP